MTTKRADSPLFNPVADSFELMKKMWGFAGLPGLPTPGSLATMAARIPQQLPSMLAPTLDVNELEKRIADLRAVEQWLELNASMLRTTIQSLEVQRATIATLKGITGAMMSPMFPKSETPQHQPPEVALGLAAMKRDEAKSAQTPDAPAVSTANKARPRGKQQPAPAMAAAALNPAAWWGSLQDQFLRVSASAADAAAQSAAASKSQAKPQAKPRRRKSKSGKPRSIA